MVQKGEVLTREDNRTSLVSRTRTAMEEDYLNVTEREIPVSTIEQTWRLKPGEETGAGRTTPKPGSFLVDVIRWLYYLGSGKVDDRLLEARYKIHQNTGINDIRY
jgi:hypothetical protein